MGGGGEGRYRLRLLYGRRASSKRPKYQNSSHLGDATVRLSKNRQVHDVVVAAMAFSSLARIRDECSTIHSSPALFFFFFEMEINSRHTKLVHSGSAS